MITNRIVICNSFAPFSGKIACTVQPSEISKNPKLHSIPHINKRANIVICWSDEDRLRRILTSGAGMGLVNINKCADEMNFKGFREFVLGLVIYFPAIISRYFQSF